MTGGSFENEFLVGSQDGYHDDFCCPPVVDSSTWLGVIGGIAVVTFFLRQSITMNLGKRRRKRKAALEEGLNHSKKFNLQIISSLRTSLTVYNLDTISQKQPPEEPKFNCRTLMWKCCSENFESSVKVLNKKFSFVDEADYFLSNFISDGKEKIEKSSTLMQQGNNFFKCIKDFVKC